MSRKGKKPRKLSWWQVKNKHQNWRKYLLKKQNGVCKICKRPFTDARLPTLDHIVPLSLDGDDSLENCQVLCEYCHRKKDGIIEADKTNQVKTNGEKQDERI